MYRLPQASLFFLQKEKKGKKEKERIGQYRIGRDVFDIQI